MSELSKVLKGKAYKRLKGIEEDVNAHKEDPVFSIFGLYDEDYVRVKGASAYIVAIHRKLGDIYERCIREIVKESLGLTDDQVRYSIKVEIAGKLVERTLDCKILVHDVRDEEAKNRLRKLIAKEVGEDKANLYEGIGLEVRFCYQIGDAKRIQADLQMAHALIRDRILPIMLIFCNLSLRQPLERFKQRTPWRVKEGMQAYSFIRELTNFDFYDFLNRIKEKAIQPIMYNILSALKRTNPPISSWA